MRTLVIMLLSLLTPALNDLDRYLENRETYIVEKYSRIKAMQQELENADDTDPESLYDLNYGLFEEYQSFKYDSAYFYAGRSLDYALKSGDRDKIVLSRCALVFCYMSSGLFLEAFDEMKAIDARGVSNDVKTKYFALYNRLCYDASDFNNTEGWSYEYTRQGTLYADSLMAIVPKDSY